MEYEEVNVSQLIEAANDFAHYPGFQNDDAAKKFLDRFPLPVIINALQTKAEEPGLQNALVDCLERLFRTKYGASFIPHFMPFVQIGLKADSQMVRRLACVTVSCFFENFDDKSVSPVQLIVQNGVYPLLIDCLVNGDERVSATSMDAIKKLVSSPEGLGIVFPADTNDSMHMRNILARSSSLGRIRVLALIVKLFSVSTTVASVVHSSNLLSLLEEEISNSNDILGTSSVLELFYELAEIEHGTEFLSRGTLLQLLGSVISNSSMDPLLRSRAMTISGRLLSNENMYKFVEQSSVCSLIASIDARLGFMEGRDSDECETALEALGHIGSSIQGAKLLLTSLPPAARHVIEAAFYRQGRGKQLAALHALANISGETRAGNNKLLAHDAEESLRFLIYETASRSPKLTPSGLFLGILQQDPDVRLAAYRLISGLVARPWCLMEICSKPEIINVVTDSATEITKPAMEARYNCCKAIHKAFFSSTQLISDPALAEIATKLEEAIRNGPYLTRKNRGAQPAVMTADRF
ncbi:hypothetical protein ACFE04_022834 [Oxalis oulophora]